MANRPPITIHVGAETSDAERKFNALFARIADGIKLGLGLDIGQRLTQAIASIPGRLEQAYQIGIGFNSQLEQANIAIAAMLHQFDPNRYGSMQKGLAASGELLKTLRREAITTTATFADLVAGSQGLLASMLSGGVPVEQIPGLTAMISRAVSTIMGPAANGYQLMQEGRALLTGDIGPQAFVARSLGISRQDVQSARQSGQLVQFLTDKLSAFNRAADLGAMTLDGLRSRLQDSLSDVLGTGMQPAFDRLKQFTQSIVNLVESPQFAEGARRIGQMADKIIAAGGLAVENRSAIFGVLEALGLVGAVAGLRRGASWAGRALGFGRGTAATLGAGQTLGLMAGQGPMAALASGTGLGLTVGATAGAGYAIGKGIGGTKFGQNTADWILGFAAYVANRIGLYSEDQYGRLLAGLNPMPQWTRKPAATSAARASLGGLPGGIGLAMYGAEQYIGSSMPLQADALERILMQRRRPISDSGLYYTAGGQAAEREQMNLRRKTVSFLKEIRDELRAGLKVQIQDF